ncbi:hypothetical protein LJR225_000408 [Phenylobacterium sp. LjRoot225]|uniref:hypothetical protein n=1 Tax=Phenylobacterium sp. LjRoot225 TaxID=3342285 RepID=UPI003ECEB63B
MTLAQPRLRFALWGALAALAAGGLIAFAMIRAHRGEVAPPPPASQGGLVIEASGAGAGRIDAAKPLRCFVGGLYVGDLTLKDCAKRNGVTTDALDVGLDVSGALAASQPGAAAVTPLPPVAAQAPPAAGGEVATPGAGASAMGECWRYADNRWRKLPSETTLNGCSQALFAGRCETAGGASYGRWAQQTLRLVPGRIEISADNHSFRILAEQGPGCSVPGGPG